MPGTVSRGSPEACATSETGAGRSGHSAPGASLGRIGSNHQTQGAGQVVADDHRYAGKMPARHARRHTPRQDRRNGV